jgi:hypothetical protein
VLAGADGRRPTSEGTKSRVDPRGQAIGMHAPGPLGGGKPVRGAEHRDDVDLVPEFLKGAHYGSDVNSLGIIQLRPVMVNDTHRERLTVHRVDRTILPGLVEINHEPRFRGRAETVPPLLDQVCGRRRQMSALTGRNPAAAGERVLL